MDPQSPQPEERSARITVPFLVVRFTPFKLMMVSCFIFAAINHLVTAFTRTGIPEPTAEHLLFAFIVCPLMIMTLFIGPWFIRLKTSIITAFTVAQFVEHFGWILWLGNDSTIFQDVQGLFAITFAIILFIFYKVGLLE